MHSHRGTSQAASSGVGPRPPFRSGISPSGLRNRAHLPRGRARRGSGGLLGALALLVAGNAYAVDGTWTRPRRGVDHRHQLELHARPCPTARRRSATTAPPIGHHLEHHLDQHHRLCGRGTRLFVHRSERGNLHRSPIRLRNSSSFLPAFSVNTGATLALGEWRFCRDRVACRRRQRRRRSLRSLHLPDYLGKHQHHVLGQTVGRRHARNRRRRSADADRPGKHDRR